MNDANLNHFFFFFFPITIFCLLILSCQAVSQEIGISGKLMEQADTDILSMTQHLPASPAIQKAKVFYNKKGLKDEINIEGPLRELNAISKTNTESIETLIEDVSIWVPQMYNQRFSVSPRCIIILEKKINKDGKAEVRFGVAMECTPKFHTTKIIQI